MSNILNSIIPFLFWFKGRNDYTGDFLGTIPFLPLKLNRREITNALLHYYTLHLTPFGYHLLTTRPSDGDRLYATLVPLFFYFLIPFDFYSKEEKKVSQENLLGRRQQHTHEKIFIFIYLFIFYYLLLSTTIYYLLLLSTRRSRTHPLIHFLLHCTTLLLLLARPISLFRFRLLFLIALRCVCRTGFPLSTSCRSDPCT